MSHEGAEAAGLPTAGEPVDLEALVADLHELAQARVAEHAASVDAEARFPIEAFDALREARLLSAYVPRELGGMGLTLAELCRLCEVLGGYDASVAMIFAMHQIQVACIVHHALDSAHWRGFLRELSERQLLLASATTELGIGGDVRRSRCAVEDRGDGSFRLEKHAPVISYGEHADCILVTARRAREASESDQVHVLVRREHTVLEKLRDREGKEIEWDTLGFRGTCSPGFRLEATGPLDDVLPVPYADIHAKSMHPVSHCTWAALWLGIATDAVRIARGVVRKQARRTPGEMPPAALRLAELDTALMGMHSTVWQVIEEVQRRLDDHPEGPFPSDPRFSIRINNLKVRASEQVVEIVGRAMLIGGISAYRNDSGESLGRHLRDAHGAAIMVNNDRILGQNAAIQLMLRGRR